jgi:peroxiredoxin
MSLIGRHDLKYEILSDTDNKLAKQFGLVYRVEGELLSAYKKLGINLEESQGNSNFELPFAAIYVVNSDGTILEAIVNYDYTNRLDPHEAIEVINTCAY